MELKPETINPFRDIGKALSEAFELIKRDLINFFEQVKEAREKIKERKNRRHNYYWNIPRLISLEDQVLTRKPITINIRTNL
ncbi:hypothetical protein SPD48_09555 [Pseudogracilibacillus sp. SE30717A]|uniref:hypothetical protein n=1 Tax=Pseudogracilibacillus sp. SE30717A TaxID=3098293 RepID=UPI00300E2A69